MWSEDRSTPLRFGGCLLRQICGIQPDALSALTAKEPFATVLRHHPGYRFPRQPHDLPQFESRQREWGESISYFPLR